MSNVLELIAQAITEQARPTEPVVAPVVVYVVAIGGAGAVVTASVGVAQSANERARPGGIGELVAGVGGQVEQLGSSAAPGPLGLPPMWTADP